ncbi:MAG: hypothetical protein BWY95_01699 [Bacteroidetes bacterium ADurb.BinA104]|nr:MAG: hypothetical protein BWY95_01699 [Bacteroidetes bacterium ADurb.BinA104]
MFVETVQDNVGRHLLLENYHNPHPCSVRLVIDIGDSFKLLVVDKVSYPPDHVSLVDHVGNFSDDNTLSSRMGQFNLRLGPDNYPSPAGFISLSYPLLAIDYTPCRKVRSLDMVHQPLGGNFRVINVSCNGINCFREVMWRHVGCHAHGNTSSSVDQKGWYPGGQHCRLLQRVIKIGLEVNSFLFNVRESLFSYSLELSLCVSHCGRTVTVY